MQEKPDRDSVDITGGEAAKEDAWQELMTDANEGKTSLWESVWLIGSQGDEAEKSEAQ